MPNAIAPALRHAFSLKVSSRDEPSRGGTLGSRAVKLIPTMKLIRPPAPPYPPSPHKHPGFQNFICSSAERSGGVQPRRGRPPPTQPPVRPQSCRGKGSDALKRFDVFFSFFFARPASVCKCESCSKASVLFCFFYLHLQTTSPRV